MLNQINENAFGRKYRHNSGLAEEGVYTYQGMKGGNLRLVVVVTVHIRVTMDPLYKAHNLYRGNLFPLRVDMNTLVMHKAHGSALQFCNSFTVPLALLLLMVIH